MIFYRRFIDDVIGIWCPHNNHKKDALEWDHFKNKMNAFPGLTWEFSERAKTIDFMDMTISINKSNKIETTLFEKRLNLHLYIPPHSAHTPGLLPGIVNGTLFQIFTLCSDNEDKLQRTKVFLNVSLPVAKKEMKFGHYSTKRLRVQKHTVDQYKLRMTTTTASSSTYRFIQTDGSFCRKQNTLYVRLCKTCEFMMCILIVDHQFNHMHPWCSWECMRPGRCSPGKRCHTFWNRIIVLLPIHLCKVSCIP